VVSQLLTLYITPVVYIYMERVQGMFGNRKRPTKPAMHDIPEPAGALGD
jgi:HAE1 family hydrophobic/amphiphilic exporter-1